MAFSPAGKAMKGEYYDDACLLDRDEKRPRCRVDEGKGQVIYISQKHENPLFPSEAENRVHLMLHFPNGMEAGKRYTLPTDPVNVCYWEKGDLLMFKSFTGSGWIEISEIKEGKSVSGKMDLKLVEPHHNMSNSDYHYMGGEFKLKWAKTPDVGNG